WPASVNVPTGEPVGFWPLLSVQIMISGELLSARPLSQMSYSNSHVPYCGPAPGGTSEKRLVMDFQRLSLVGIGNQVSWTFGDVLTAPSPVSLFMAERVYQ